MTIKSLVQVIAITHVIRLLDLYSPVVTLRTTWFQHQKFYILPNIVKGKAILLQAWTGPEGSRRLRLPNLKTIGT